MLEVRYVLSLEHHDISIYGGGEHIPDGELFIKRNALCLSRKTDAGEMRADGIPSKPFFLFADNTSDKEDFYFAMLKNQEHKPDGLNNPPVPLQFDIKNMIALVQRLHSSEEHLQTRWLNAMLGRIFLGLYKTSDVENWVRAKITKKISRVKKPSFLSGIILRDVDMGEGAPLITNPRLKDLTVEGDCTIEADLRYTGNFRLEIAAIARIDLGTRFKAREVNLLLAVVLKKIEGHCYARIKPPPSNRIWLTFSQPPKIEMSIEPIVSSRQITYTLILRQIENRIKEVIAESIVMPYWDDIAFYSTEGKRWRGGIWVDDTPTHSTPDLDTAVDDGDVDEVEQIESEVLSNPMPTSEKSMSVPMLETTQSPPPYSRKTARSLFNLTNTKATASSSSIETNKSHVSEKPRVLRHGSFTSASSPIVGMDITNVDAFKPATPPEHSDAASAMAALSARSHTSSPTETPLGSPPSQSAFKKMQSESSVSTSEQDVLDDPNTLPAPDHTGNDPSNSNWDFLPSSPVNTGDPTHQPDSTKSMDNAPQRNRFSSSSAKSVSASENSQESAFTATFLSNSRRQDSTSSKSIGSAENPPTPPKRIMLSTVANAAATAKRWGINALQRNVDQSRRLSADHDDVSSHLNQPMGRGRPLPPPGVPLPRPDRRTPTAPIPVPKRKPLPPPVLPARPKRQESASTESSATESAEKLPPLPKRRPNQNQNGASEDERGQGQWDINENVNDDGIFVLAAPPDSEPTTPLGEARQNYMQPWVDDVDEEPAREELSETGS